MATEGTILRLKKLALIENASPDNSLTLIPVTEDAEGSALFGVTNEAGNITIGNGQLYLNRVNPELSVICLKPDSSDVTQIESWVDNQTDIYASGITIDGGILFGDKETTSGTVKLVANEQLSDNDVYAFNIQKDATPGFDSSTGIYQNGFWVAKNLVGGYEWGDADGDGFANGWDTGGSAFSSLSFSSGQQTLEAGTSYGQFEREIYFPFEGEQLTFSIDIDSRSGTYSTELISIFYLDSSGSTLSSSTVNVSSTGRKSTTGQTPANTVALKVLYRLGADSGTVTSIVSDPALKLGTDSTYSTF